MRHIDDGQLHAYLDRALHAAEFGRVEEMELHLADCAVCQMRLEREGSPRTHLARRPAGVVEAPAVAVAWSR